MAVTADAVKPSTTEIHVRLTMTIDEDGSSCLVMRANGEKKEQLTRNAPDPTRSNRHITLFPLFSPFGLLFQARYRSMSVEVRVRASAVPARAPTR